MSFASVIRGPESLAKLVSKKWRHPEIKWMTILRQSYVLLENLVSWHSCGHSLTHSEVTPSRQQQSTTKTSQEQWERAQGVGLAVPKIPVRSDMLKQVEFMEAPPCKPQDLIDPGARHHRYTPLKVILLCLDRLESSLIHNEASTECHFSSTSHGFLAWQHPPTYF